MSKIFLFSVAVSLSCFFIGGSGARALTPNPDAPVAPHVPFPMPRPVTPLPLPPQPMPFEKPPIAVKPILPLPNNWPYFQIVSTTVQGTIQSVSTSFMFVVQPSVPQDDIGTMEQPVDKLIKLPLSEIVSSTPGVITLYMPAVNTTTKVIVSAGTIIRNAIRQQIDTINLNPGNNVTVSGLRFRGGEGLIFADLIQDNSYLPFIRFDR